jgi:magnesium transporter
MLTAYVFNESMLERRLLEPGEDIPPAAVWIDLVSPALGEDKMIEKLLGIAVPTREEMQEIEVSSRLYIEDGARFMTAVLMCQSDTSSPRHTPVTFILARQRLVTVRYDEPRPFAMVDHKLSRSCAPTVTGEAVLCDLLEAVVDRAADILERAGAEVDAVSHAIFEPEQESSPVLSQNEILRSLGRKGDLASKVRESLVSVGRVLIFLLNEAEGMRWSKDTRMQLKSMQRDVSGLTDHATYLTNKITFQLDAMLGMVSIQQNDIIKIFSVAAVVFMPPTLIASIYGMNFRHMPELDWTLGYPTVIGILVLAAAGPLAFFKWKKWL